MTEPDAPLHEQYSEMLRVLAADRDEILEAVDGSYARALASGGSADALYRDYIAERDAVINKFRLDAVGIGKDYTHQASVSAPPLATTPGPPPAFPPPQPPPGAPGPAAPGPHSWQTPAPTSVPVATPVRAAKSPWRVVLGIAVVGAMLVGVTSWATAGNRTSSSGSSSSYTGTVSSTRTVTYEVVGGATKAGITYSTPSGTSQATVAVPLKTKTGELVTFEAEPGEFVYLSAQNKGTHGNIVCRISVDGVVISTVTSSGSYAIASCEGTVR